LAITNNNQPNDIPVIKAASSFVGLGVISTDFYVDKGGLGVDGLAKEWYINTVSHKCIGSYIRAVF
jgi:hypothetical protein